MDERRFAMQIQVARLLDRELSDATAWGSDDVEYSSMVELWASVLLRSAESTAEQAPSDAAKASPQDVDEEKGNDIDTATSAHATCSEAAEVSAAAMGGGGKDEPGEAGGLTPSVRSWYTGSEAHWRDAARWPATVDSMLGGFGDKAAADAKESLALLREVQRSGPAYGTKRALDVGAGIGRVTRDVLGKVFDKVDLVEQCPRFVEQGRKLLADFGRVGTWHTVGFQDFIPSERYDCVWIQWALCYLTDADALLAMKRCIQVLNPGGIIVVKGNLSDVEEHGAAFLDLSDNSVIRNDEYNRWLFDAAGLKVVSDCKQQDWPEDNFELHAYVLRPAVATAAAALSGR